MTNKISSYKELLEEKERLETLFKAQKELLRQDVAQIKLELKPAMNAASFVGKLVTRDNSNPLLNLGANSAIDLIVKKLILSRAGWIGKLIIPYIMKNFTSHVIDDNVDNIKKGFSKLVSKFSRNGKKEKVAE